MIKEAIEKLFDSAMKREPLIKRMKEINKEENELENKINKLQESGTEDLKNIVERIKIINNSNLEDEILQTAKNSVKTKTGRIEIKFKFKDRFYDNVERNGIIILTRNKFSIPFYTSGQARYDINLNSFSILRGDIFFKHDYDTIIKFPISEFAEHPKINKEHFIKFTEFLSRYILEFKNNKDTDYNFDYAGIRIFRDRNWDGEQHKYVDKLKFRENEIVYVTKTDVAERLEKFLNDVEEKERNKVEFLEEIKRFNAAENLLRKLT